MALDHYFYCADQQRLDGVVTLPLDRFDHLISWRLKAAEAGRISFGAGVQSVSTKGDFQACPEQCQ